MCLYTQKLEKLPLTYTDTSCNELDCMLQCDPPLSLSVLTLYQRINWINSVDLMPHINSRHPGKAP